MRRQIAVIVAHPDDEVLGFGGTIARHADEGADVDVLILATGLAARGKPDVDALTSLRAQADAAAKILGVNDLVFGDFPDNRMDGAELLDVVKAVEAFLDGRGVTDVYTHHAGDLNIDHQICARAVLTACRPVPGATMVRVLAGEVPSSSEYAAPGDRFVPNTYNGIAGTLDRKCAALKCYAEELRPWPHPRSIEAVEFLARWRGSECGLEAAEAFDLLREVRR